MAHTHIVHTYIMYVQYDYSSKVLHEIHACELSTSIVQPVFCMCLNIS